MWEQKQRKLSELALTDSVPLCLPILFVFALHEDLQDLSPFSFFWDLHCAKMCLLSFSYPPLFLSYAICISPRYAGSLSHFLSFGICIAPRFAGSLFPLSFSLSTVSFFGICRGLRSACFTSAISSLLSGVRLLVSIHC